MLPWEGPHPCILNPDPAAGHPAGTCSAWREAPLLLVPLLDGPQPLPFADPSLGRTIEDGKAAGRVVLYCFMACKRFCASCCLTCCRTCATHITSGPQAWLKHTSMVVGKGQGWGGYDRRLAGAGSASASGHWQLSPLRPRVKGADRQ